MNYWNSEHFITHQHESARQFDSKMAAEQVAGDLNAGRPEGLKPFRVEQCKSCERFHVRRGKNVLVKAIP